MNVDITPYDHKFIVAFLAVTKEEAAEWKYNGDVYTIFIKHDNEKSEVIRNLCESQGFKFIGNGKKGKHWSYIYPKRK